jgi:hypothetical protein
MKKIITMMAVGAMVTVASADITTFQWSGGITADYSAGLYVHTILDADSTADIWGFISGGQIDVLDLQAFSAIDSQVMNEIPSFFGGGWSTENILDNSTARVGQYAFAVISTEANFANIADGATISITQVGGPIVDLQPGGTGGVALPQAFNPGTTSSVTVVPEPATIGLFGLGALSAWFIRRSKKVA